MNNEQLAALRREAQAISEVHPSKDARAFSASALLAIDALTARIAELEAGRVALIETAAFRVGNLVTINQDEYPALGGLFAQLWDGDSVAARVYGPASSRGRAGWLRAISNTLARKARRGGPFHMGCRYLIGKSGSTSAQVRK